MPYHVLVTDGIDADGVALLAAEPTLVVDEVPTLPVNELLDRIGRYDAIVGRSATRISKALLERAERLRVVGRAGVGVDNIALEAATALGVAVINAPAGNTVAVAELVFGTLLALLRQIPQADRSMHEGRWDRSQLMGNELKGRTIGIVGAGRIGGEVSVRAHAFGMSVVGYDPYVSEERFRTLRMRRAETLDDLLAESDVVTVHTPLTNETLGMIGRRELGRLKPGAVVVNLARGGIVDEEALAAALAGDRLRGAVIDVFTTEPLPAEHPLRGLGNVLLTPHMGASTFEAQRNVAVDVCAAVRDALLDGDLARSINVADMSGAGWRDLQPALIVAQRAAALARALLADQGARAVQRITVRCGPEAIGGGGALLAAAAVGALESVLGTDRLNLINARSLAEARGIDLTVGESSHLGHPQAVEVALGGGMQEIAVAGLALPGSVPRLTRIGGFQVDVTLRQTLVVLTNRDVPGVIGRVGTLLGDASVNIAEYHQARLAQGGDALAAISVDSVVGDEIRQKLLELPDVRSATIVNFRAP